MLCKWSDFLCTRDTDVAYTRLPAEEEKIVTSQPKPVKNPFSDPEPEPPLPSPFREIRMIGKPGGQKLMSLGVIAIGMALAGLVILVDLRAEDAAAMKAAAEENERKNSDNGAGGDEDIGGKQPENKEDTVETEATKDEHSAESFSPANIY
ncbi:unnamed protein product [Caenorhabditis brenneri]